ncbi:hypothetical protein [Spirosoma spitsbergense]|uniref:hypothetical protein n=1 Tax=Spirosoma spitsbergense TaxID=431554 RepID=UPI0003607ADC|nr:hypothetical protein [Spirosoma spitsbergense]
MTFSNYHTKRQLLSDLLTGKTDALRAYQRQQAVCSFPFRWVIDARAVSEGIRAIGKQGENTPMSEQEFEQLPQTAPIWKIIDFTGGLIPPGIDE